MVRYSIDDIQKSKDRILKAASMLFRVHGFNGVGIDKICIEAGLTKGTFYSHFKSKRDLFSEVIKLTSNKRTSFLDHILNEKSNAPIQDLIKWYLSDKHYENHMIGCLMPRLSGDLSTHMEYDSNTVQEYLLGLEEVVHRFGENKEKGNIIFCSLIGALTLARIKSGEDGKKFLRKARKDIMSYTRRKK